LKVRAGEVHAIMGPTAGGNQHSPMRSWGIRRTKLKFPILNPKLLLMVKILPIFHGRNGRNWIIFSVTKSDCRTGCDRYECTADRVSGTSYGKKGYAGQNTESAAFPPLASGRHDDYRIYDYAETVCQQLHINESFVPRYS